ncbi:MAG: hypothetical protein QF464_12490 [Myxococcota bacterium]|nr:hypothetical protein [Myxococcota bacterium]
MRTLCLAVFALVFSVAHAHAASSDVAPMWAQVERSEASIRTAQAEAQRHIDSDDAAFAIRSLETLSEAARRQMTVLDELIVVEQDLDRQTEALLRQGRARHHLERALETIALLRTGR